MAIAQTLVVMAGLAITGTATASVPFQVLEPADYTLSFHQVVSGVPTPTKRILLRNITPDPASGDARFGGPDFTWSANTPVRVGPGQYVGWDIACNTDNPAGAQQWFDLDWCGVDCDQSSGVLSISAECSPPVMTLSALQLDFPPILRSETQQQTVTITNITSGPVTWPVEVTGSAFALVGGGAIALAAGASADVTVEFRPREPGDHTGTLEIGAAGDPAHFTVALGGTATAPMVTCDRALAFGEVAVGDTAEAMLAIHNLDPAHSFRIAQLPVVDSGVFIAALPANATLAPAATLMVDVLFSPRAAGAHTARLLVLLDNDPVPIAVVDLTGDGVGHGGGGGGCSATGAPGAAPLLALAFLVLGRRRRAARAASATTGR